MPSGSRLITLDARPEPVRIEAGRAAVLVVDMQNDFGARGGMFDRAGIDIAPIQRAVEPPRGCWRRRAPPACRSSTL
jgi:ureidoacrylate peracid hydrolase